ncbi:GAF domain-containing protein [Pedobacter steynii]
MYQLLENKKNDQDSYVVSKTPAEYHKERLQLVYSFILKELYNFHVPVKMHQYHAGIKSDTGLLGYFHVNLNTDFIEVTPKGELPPLNFRELQQYIGEGSSYEILEKILPLDLFRFRGISVITVSDVTAIQAVENIKNIRLTRTPGDQEATYSGVIQSLKTIVQNNKIEFDLFPFVKVNNKPVYGNVKGGTGILFSVWGEDNLDPETFQQYAEGYSANPDSFFSPDILAEDPVVFHWLHHFVKLGVKSLALTPVFYDHSIVGVLAVHTWEGETFDEKILALLEPAIAPIAQLLQIYIDEFNLELENIIKEKFTSIQPSVQWKFNEVAWHHMHDKKKHLPIRNEDISFKEVYPFYGAIDIRNSTVERNMASKADLSHHLNILSQILDQLKDHHYSSLMEEMIFNSRKWQQVLLQEVLNTQDETNLNSFLKEESSDYLFHLSQQEPKLKKLIDDYLLLTGIADGDVHKNRYALEVSMQMINTAINNFLKQKKRNCSNHILVISKNSEPMVLNMIFT